MTEVTPDAYRYTSDDGSVELILDCHGEQARRLIELGYTECPLYARTDALAEARDALKEAREALHFHYVEWDGEPEDAVPLQLARQKCFAALSRLNAQGEVK